MSASISFFLALLFGAIRIFVRRLSGCILDVSFFIFRTKYLLARSFLQITLDEFLSFSNVLSVSDSPYSYG